MSREVDQRVVEMQFDNAQFERETKKSLGTIEKLKASLNFGDASKSLDGITKAAAKLDLTPVSDGVDGVTMRFKALDVVAATVLSDITRKVENVASSVIKAFTVDPVKTGLAEYETQINSVQTILANTQSKGTTLEEVNAALDELNRYADMTIYNFTEMTRNIGTFTAAGVGLDKSVQAIKGIANLAAVSGSTSQQASTAMYQLSQAMAAGTVKLMDWNSVVNAGMGGQVFQDALKETARVHGIAIDDMIAKEGSFRETLQHGWLTTSILTETLAKFTGDLSESELRDIGYTDEQIKSIMQMGVTANEAATKVKTFTQLIDTLKEAVQSGWTQSWEYIIGDFEEAKELWTEISDRLQAIINQVSDARNSLLRSGLASGWKQLLGEGIEDYSDYFSDILAEVGKAAGAITQDEIDNAGGLTKTFEQGWLTADLLSGAIAQVVKETDALASKSDEELAALGIERSSIEKMQESYSGLIEKIQNGTVTVEEFVEKINRPSGRENLFQSLLNIMDAVGAAAKPITTAFNEIFPPMTGDTLYNITVALRDFTEGLILSEDTIDKLTRIFKGLFSIIKIGTNTIKKIGSTITSKLFTPLDNFGDHVSSVVSNVLEFTALVGDFLVMVSEFGTGADAVSEKFDEIRTSVSNLFAPLKRVGSYISELNFGGNGNRVLNSFTNGFSKLSESIRELGISGTAISSFGDIVGMLTGSTPDMANFGSAASASLDFLGKVASNLGAVLTTAIGLIINLPSILSGAFNEFTTGVVEGFKDVSEAVSAAFEPFENFFNLIHSEFNKLGGIDLYRLLSLIDVGLLAMTIGQLSKTVKSMTKEFKDPVTKMLDSISGAFSSISSAATAWKKQQTVKNIQSIAIAMLALSGALYVLSKIDTVDLLVGLGAIIAMTATLVIALGQLQKSLEKISTGKLIGLAVVMTSIAGSATILSNAIHDLVDAIMPSGESESLAYNVLVFGTVVAALTTLMMAVGKLGTMMTGVSARSMVSLSVVFVSLGVSLKSMSASVSALSNIDIWGLISGLTTAISLISAMSIMVSSTDFSKLGILSGVNLIGIATSIYIVAKAVEKLATIGDMTNAAIAVGEIVGIMLGLSAVSLAAKGLKFSAGAAIVAMSSSLLILYKAIEKFAGMDLKTFANGLGKVAGGLAVLTVAALALSLNLGGVLSASVGMIAMAGALQLIAGVIERFASMDSGSLWNSIGAFVITLVGMTTSIVALSLVSGSLAAVSTALLGISASMLVLSASIKLLGSLDVVSILTGIAAIFAALVGMMGAGALLAYIPGLSAGLLVLSYALGQLSKAFLSFAAAALAMTVAGVALGILATFSGPICQAIVGAAPDIQEALITLITVVCNVIIATIDPVLDALTAVAVAVGARLYVLIQELWPVAKQALSDLGNKIKQGLYDMFVNHDYFGFSFLNPQKWADLFSGGLEGFQDAWNSLWIPNYQVYTASGEYVAEGLSEGMENGTGLVKKSGEKLANTADESIRSAMEINSPSKVAIRDGEYVAQGYAEGIQNGIPAVNAAILSLATSSDSVFRNYWGIHSNADRGIDNGKYIDGGHAQGITDNAYLVYDATNKLATGVQESLMESGAAEFSYGYGALIRKNLIDGLQAKQIAEAAKNPLVDKDNLANEFKTMIGQDVAGGLLNVNTDDIVSGLKKTGNSVGDALSGFFGLDDTGITEEYLKKAEETLDEYASSAASASGGSSGAKKEKTVAEQIEEKYKDQVELNKLLMEAAESEYQLWLTENQNGASSDELLAKKLEYTANEIQIQTDRVKLAQSKYDDMLASLGESDADTKQAYVDLLDEKNKLAELKAEQYVGLYEDAIDRLQTEQDLADKEYELWTAKNTGASDSDKTYKKIENINAQLSTSAEELTLAEEQYKKLLEEYGEADRRTMEAKGDWLDTQIEYQEKQNELWEAQLEEFDNAINAIDRKAEVFEKRSDMLSKIYGDGDLSSRSDDYINAVEQYGKDSKEARRAQYQGSASAVLGVATALRNMSDQLSKTNIYQDKYNKLVASGTATSEELAAAEQELLASKSSFIDYAENLADAFDMDEEGKAITLRLAYAISDNWSTIYDAFEKVWGKIENKFPNLASKIEKAFGGLIGEDAASISVGLVSTVTSALSGDYGGAIVSGLVTFIDFAGSGLGQSMISAISNAFSIGLSGIGAKLTSLIGSSGLLSSLSSVASGLTASFAGSGGLMAALGSVSGALSGVVALLPELLPIILIGAAAIGIIALLASCWDEIGDFFTGVIDKITEFGANLAEGFVEGVKNVWNGVVSFFKSIFGGILDLVSGIFDINSPSKVMYEFGRYAIEGFKDGVAAMSDGASESVGNLMNYALDNARNISGMIHDYLADDSDRDYSITPVVDLSAAENSADWLHSAFSGMDKTVSLNTERSARLAFEADGKRNQNGKIETDATRSQVVAAIDELSDRVVMMGESIESMQVSLDSNKLVGGIIGKIDSQLGKRATRAKRGG